MHCISGVFGKAVFYVSHVGGTVFGVLRNRERKRESKRELYILPSAAVDMCTNIIFIAG